MNILGLLASKWWDCLASHVSLPDFNGYFRSKGVGTGFEATWVWSEEPLEGNEVGRFEAPPIPFHWWININYIHPGRLTNQTWKSWWFGSDDFPNFQWARILRFHVDLPGCEYHFWYRRIGLEGRNKAMWVIQHPNFLEDRGATRMLSCFTYVKMAWEDSTQLE